MTSNTNKEDYIRSLIEVMSRDVAPHIAEMSGNDLMNVAIDLSLCSPIVRGAEPNKENMRIHQLTGMGCAALFLMVTAKAVNTTQEVVGEQDES